MKYIMESIDIIKLVLYYNIFYRFSNHVIARAADAKTDSVGKHHNIMWKINKIF